jgi:hypothetical protein
MRQSDRAIVPTSQLDDTLAQARALYGAGMGFASLVILESIVRATVGLRWKEGGELSDILTVVDADISQAIQVSNKFRYHPRFFFFLVNSQSNQSSKEEIDAGRVGDFTIARQIVGELRAVVRDSFHDCEVWGGEFPFERASGSIEFWKI